MSINTLPSPRVREFLPQEFKITVWSKLKPYYNELLKRPIQSALELERWILDSSELDALFEEELHQRYIAMISNPEDARAADSFAYAKSEITPHIQSIKKQLNDKFLDDPFSLKLDGPSFETYYRVVKSEYESFEISDLKLYAEIEDMLRTYSKIITSSTFIHNDQTYNFTQVKSLLQSPDRTVRKAIYKKVSALQIQNAPLINSIFDGLVQKRSQLASKSGYDNYRNYRFNQTARYDYTSETCHELYDFIGMLVCPLVEDIFRKRKKSLALDTLRPWDLEVPLPKDTPTKFEPDSNTLIQKTIQCLDAIHPFFANCIQKMQQLNHINLNNSDSTPFGASAIALPLTGVPYLYLNSKSNLQHIGSFLQLCGQAIHLCLVNKHNIHVHRQIPSELSSLSAMTMQLLAFENGKFLFNDEAAARQAKKWLLENILIQLPWMAAFDRFQHWVYKNPQHSQEERDEAWRYIYTRFHSTTIDFEGFEEAQSNYWHQASSIFNTPLNYIENAFGLFGAIAIWKQYLESPKVAIEQFKNAMEAGYTLPINEIFNIAGIPFFPSEEYIESLVAFVQAKLAEL